MLVRIDELMEDVVTFLESEKSGKDSAIAELFSFSDQGTTIKVRRRAR